jgi:hypothetical protein
MHAVSRINAVLCSTQPLKGFHKYREEAYISGLCVTVNHRALDAQAALLPASMARLGW